MKPSAFFAFLSILGIGIAPAALTESLVAYYNFEETGTAGLANKAPSSTNFNGTFIGTPIQESGSGFAGNAAFPGASTAGTTNRSPLLIGHSLNVAKGVTPAANGGQFTVSTLTSRGTGAGASGEEFGTLGTSFSISTWFYSAPDADNSALAADALRQFIFESNLDGASTGQVYDLSWGSASGSTNYLPYANTIAGTGTAIAHGGWHNVVQTYSSDGTTTSQVAYVDGVQTWTGTTATTNVDFRGINFGANRTGTARVLDGMIDEVGVWKRALTAGEALELFNRGKTGQTILSSAQAINLTATPTLSGTTTGTGVYLSGAVVQVIATPVAGYLFTEWLGDFAGKPASFSHTVEGPVTAQAVFGEDLNDADKDGLTNFEEVTVYHTLPDNADTDGDLIPDGAEVTTTLTSPIASDANLVSFIRKNLTTGKAGGIALTPLRIERDSTTGAVSLFLSLKSSADQSVWQTVNLSQSSIVPSGDGWNITFPAPSNTVNNYIISSDTP